MITFEFSLDNIGKGSTNKNKERKTLNTLEEQSIDG